MSRKIILVECCRLCPFSHSTSMFIDICIRIVGENEIPAEVFMSDTVWDQCPLDDAEGFV